MKQMSDLFVEQRYFKFQNEIQFFLNTMMEHWNAMIQKAFMVALGLQVPFSIRLFLCFILLASYYLHDKSLLMTWRNIFYRFL